MAEVAKDTTPSKELAARIPDGQPDWLRDLLAEILGKLAKLEHRGPSR